MKYFYIVSILIIVVLATGAFLFLPPKEIVIKPDSGAKNYMRAVPITVLPLPPEAGEPTSSPAAASMTNSKDIPNQPQLQNPPTIVKAIYSTSWSAGSASRLKYLIGVINRANLNGIVIDIKDYSGHVAYHTGIPEVLASGAENEIRILRPNALLKQLHDDNIYVIGRVTVFQDPILAKAHPEWALKNAVSGKAWTDNKGLMWLDPAAKPVWDYVVELAKDALNRGFDEINFDYIRFPSDGNLEVIRYPFWDEKIPKHAAIKKFFEYLRKELPDAKISADLFGLATVESHDLGIGQVIEDAYPYFDYVSPMVYPSHYSAGFLGYKNPAQYPYEVVKYSIESALRRLSIMTNEHNNDNAITTGSSSSVIGHGSPFAKLRPWLQAFDLGTVYNHAMIQKQINAVEEILRPSSGTEQSVDPETFAGWLLWDPANIYKNL